MKNKKTLLELVYENMPGAKNAQIKAKLMGAKFEVIGDPPVEYGGSVNNGETVQFDRSSMANINTGSNGPSISNLLIPSIGGHSNNIRMKDLVPLNEDLFAQTEKEVISLVGKYMSDVEEANTRIKYEQGKLELMKRLKLKSINESTYKSYYLLSAMSESSIDPKSVTIEELAEITNITQL